MIRQFSCSIQQSIILCGRWIISSNKLCLTVERRGIHSRIGGFGREFLDRVGSSARKGREGGGLWYIHVTQAARDCVVRIARRN
jgi:hypothetical protein